MKKVKHFSILFITVALLLCINKCFAQTGPQMIAVAGGTFNMGDETDLGLSIGTTLHSVTLVAFKISRTEITVAQWKTYCTATGKNMPNSGTNYAPWKWNDDNPIVNITWDEAVAYCQWLSKKTGHTYRLPTEAEWEYAARGGKSGKGFLYSGSQNPDVVGWHSADSGGVHTHPVAMKKPNELGLFDMTGNVWEWCSDWYSDTYYGNKPVANPKGPPSGTKHVLRGGAYDTPPSACTVFYRDAQVAGYSKFNCGFRVVEE
jgi:sulfatase modifying factor 1